MNKWLVALIAAIVVIAVGYHYWGRSVEVTEEIVTEEVVDPSTPAAEAPAAEEAAPVAQTLLVEDPFANATQGESTAVWMEIRNEGDVTDNLIGATSPVSTKTELHSHQTEGAVVTMVPVQEVSLPAHQKVSFKPDAPGGFHIMLMGLSAPLQAGDQVPVELTFEKAGKMNIVATVRPTEEKAADAPAAA